MIFTKKIIGIGSSSVGIAFPKKFVDSLDLEKGDTVQLSVEVVDIMKKDSHIVSYRCRGCQHVFDTDDEYVECPACGCEECVIITEDVNGIKEIE